MMGRKIMGETGIKPIVIEEICGCRTNSSVPPGNRYRGS